MTTPPALQNAVVWRGESENGRCARLHADGTLIPAWGNVRSEQNAQRQLNRAFAELLGAVVPFHVWTCFKARNRESASDSTILDASGFAVLTLGHVRTLMAALRGSPAVQPAEPAARADSVGEPLADGTAAWEVRPASPLSTTGMSGWSASRQEWSTFESPAIADEAALAEYNAASICACASGQTCGGCR